MSEIQAKAYKLKSGEWGVKVEPRQSLETGTIVHVETKIGGYRAAVRNLIFESDENKEKGWPSCSVYGVNRIPDIKGDNCPTCGQPVEKQNRSTSKPTQRAAEEPKEDGKPFDDDIPF